MTTVQDHAAYVMPSWERQLVDLARDFAGRRFAHPAQAFGAAQGLLSGVACVVRRAHGETSQEAPDPALLAQLDRAAELAAVSSPAELRAWLVRHHRVDADSYRASRASEWRPGFDAACMELAGLTYRVDVYT